MQCACCGAADAPYRCTGCDAVRYCNAECQREHWTAAAGAGGHEGRCNAAQLGDRLQVPTNITRQLQRFDATLLVPAQEALPKGSWDWRLWGYALTPELLFRLPGIDVVLLPPLLRTDGSALYTGGVWVRQGPLQSIGLGGILRRMPGWQAAQNGVQEALDAFARGYMVARVREGPSGQGARFFHESWSARESLGAQQAVVSSIRSVEARISAQNAQFLRLRDPATLEPLLLSPLGLQRAVVLVLLRRLRGGGGPLEAAWPQTRRASRRSLVVVSEELLVDALRDRRGGWNSYLDRLQRIAIDSDSVDVRDALEDVRLGVQPRTAPERFGGAGPPTPPGPVRVDPQRPVAGAGAGALISPVDQDLNDMSLSALLEDFGMGDGDPPPVRRVSAAELRADRGVAVTVEGGGSALAAALDAAAGARHRAVEVHVGVDTGAGDADPADTTVDMSTVSAESTGTVRVLDMDVTPDWVLRRVPQDSRAWRELLLLDLSGLNLHGRSLQWLLVVDGGGAPRFPRLGHLILRNCALTTADLETLRMPEGRRLFKVDLRGNSIHRLPHSLLRPWSQEGRLAPRADRDALVARAHDRWQVGDTREGRGVELRFRKVLLGPQRGGTVLELPAALQLVAQRPEGVDRQLRRTVLQFGNAQWRALEVLPMPVIE